MARVSSNVSCSSCESNSTTRLVGQQPGICARRLAATDEDYVDAFRNLLGRIDQQRSGAPLRSTPPGSCRRPGTAGRGRRLNSSRKKRRLNPARSDRYSGVNSGRGLRFGRHHVGCGKPEVVEERRRVAHHRCRRWYQKPPQLPALEVTGHQSSLAGAWWAADPDQRMRSMLIEHAEDSRPRASAPRQLGGG